MKHILPHVWNKYVRNNEPLYVTTDLSVMFNSESDWEFLEDELHDVINSGKIRIDGWTARIHAEHWDDDRRFWVAFSIWNDEDDLVISGRHAGREGDDHVEHFYHDVDAYSELLGELFLIRLKFDESITKRNDEDDHDGDYTIKPLEFYGRDLSLENETQYPNRRYWADTESEPETNVVSFVDEVAKIKGEEDSLTEQLLSLKADAAQMNIEYRDMMQNHAFSFRNCYGPNVPQLVRYTQDSRHNNWQLTLVSHNMKNLRPSKLHFELMSNPESHIRTSMQDWMLGLNDADLDTVICFFYAHPKRDVVHVCSLYFKNNDPRENYTFVGDDTLFSILLDSFTPAVLITVDHSYENELPDIDM